MSGTFGRWYGRLILLTIAWGGTLSAEVPYPNPASAPAIAVPAAVITPVPTPPIAPMVTGVPSLVPTPPAPIATSSFPMPDELAYSPPTVKLTTPTPVPTMRPCPAGQNPYDFAGRRACCEPGEVGTNDGVQPYCFAGPAPQCGTKQVACPGFPTRKAKTGIVCCDKMPSGSSACGMQTDGTAACLLDGDPNEKTVVPPKSYQCVVDSPFSFTFCGNGQRCMQDPDSLKATCKSTLPCGGTLCGLSGQPGEEICCPAESRCAYSKSGAYPYCLSDDTCPADRPNLFKHFVDGKEAVICCKANETAVGVLRDGPARCYPTEKL